MQPDIDVAGIRARWSELNAFDLRSALVSGQSPFGVTDKGLQDFRGIAISQVLNKIQVERADFSYSVRALGQLGGAARFRDCIFDGSVYEGTIYGEFEGCSFKEARLSGSVLMGGFISCDLEAADLSRCRASQVKFEDCRFVIANLRKASFFDCVFVHCALDGCKWRSGSVAGSRFQECTFVGADFTKTVVQRAVGLPS
jgi:uncharacterized protein YjbI with pentapeptide repeats